MCERISSSQNPMNRPVYHHESFLTTESKMIYELINVSFYLWTHWDTHFQLFQKKNPIQVFSARSRSQLGERNLDGFGSVGNQNIL